MQEQFDRNFKTKIYANKKKTSRCITISTTKTNINKEILVSLIQRAWRNNIPHTKNTENYEPVTNKNLYFNNNNLCLAVVVF